MLKRAVFSLSLLPYDHQIQVIVAGAVSRKALHVNHIGKQIQLSPATKNEHLIQQNLAGERLLAQSSYDNIFKKYLSLISYDASSPLYSIGVWIFPNHRERIKICLLNGNDQCHSLAILSDIPFSR